MDISGSRGAHRLQHPRMLFRLFTSKIKINTDINFIREEGNEMREGRMRREVWEGMEYPFSCKYWTRTKLSSPGLCIPLHSVLTKIL